jgi:hypothetical protein
MLIWQGLGAFAFVIPIAAWVALAVIMEVIGGSGASKANAAVLVGLGLVASAPVIYWLAARIDRRPARTLIDKESGQEVVLRERHTMFFIPLRSWAWVYAVGGVIVTLAALTD